MTAAELMAQLSSDRAFQTLQAENEAKRAEIQEVNRDAARPIVDELRGMGIGLTTLTELARLCAPIPTHVIAVLLRWLSLITNEMVQEQIVRSLAASQVSFDGKPLVELFERTRSEGLRWAIANTLAEAHAEGVAAWLLSAVSNPAYGKAREMLLLAVARQVPPKRANEVLVPLFEEFPGHVAMALAESGGEEEFEFLRSKRRISKGWVRKEINRAIRSIQSRTTSATKPS